MAAGARYGAILRAPHVGALLAASLVARLPIAMFGLALVLYLAAARDSFALAGLVNGAFGIGSAIGTPLQSRLIDRLGQRRVLLPLACIDLIATCVLVLLTEADAPAAALVAAGAVGGFALPACSARWPRRRSWPSSRPWPPCCCAARARCWARLPSSPRDRRAAGSRTPRPAATACSGR